MNLSYCGTSSPAHRLCKQTAVLAGRIERLAFTHDYDFEGMPDLSEWYGADLRRFMLAHMGYRFVIRGAGQAGLWQRSGRLEAKVWQAWGKGQAGLGQSLGKTWAKCGQDFAKAWARLWQSLGKTCAKLGQDLGKVWARRQDGRRAGKRRLPPPRSCNYLHRQNNPHSGRGIGFLTVFCGRSSLKRGQPSSLQRSS